jgi:multidrug efflux pump subunit AcrA (membrane-fusion protein)
MNGTDGAASDGTATPAPPPLPRKLQPKVHGKVRDFDLDNNEHLRELQTLAEIGLGGKERFAKAHEIEQLAKQREEALRRDPWSVLQEMGLDPDRLAEERVWAVLERQKALAQMSPEAQAQAYVQQERARLEQERTEFFGQQQEAELAREQERVLPMFVTHAPTALKTAGLANEKGEAVGPALGLFKEYVSTAIDAGQQVSPELLGYAAQAVRRDLGDMLTSFAGSLEGQALADFLGPAITKKLRMHDYAEHVAKRGKAGQPTAPQPNGTPTPKREPERGYITMNEYMKGIKEG